MTRLTRTSTPQEIAFGKLRLAASGSLSFEAVIATEVQQKLAAVLQPIVVGWEKEGLEKKRERKAVVLPAPPMPGVRQSSPPSLLGTEHDRAIVEYQILQYAREVVGTAILASERFEERDIDGLVQFITIILPQALRHVLEYVRDNSQKLFNSSSSPLPYAGQDITSYNYLVDFLVAYIQHNGNAVAAHINQTETQFNEQNWLKQLLRGTPKHLQTTLLELASIITIFTDAMNRLQREPRQAILPILMKTVHANRISSV